MRVVSLIARKYFFSRKNPSAINIITTISLLGYTLGAMALLILLSALNGFEESIFGEYEKTSPELQITPKSGKVIAWTDSLDKSLKNTEGVLAVGKVVEDKAIIKYGNKQLVGVVKGVDTAYFDVVNLNQQTSAGECVYNTNPDKLSEAWLSEGIVYKLSVGNNEKPLELMVPDRTSGTVAQTVLNQEVLSVGAMLHLAEEENESAVYVPLHVAEMLFMRENEYTSIAVKTSGNAEGVKTRIKKLLGNQVQILNKQEQHQTVYKMFNTEKWFSFALMAFIIGLISYNLFGVMRMMRLEKKQDIYLLQTLGMSNNKIQRVFRLNGMVIVGIGTTLGVFLSLLLVFLQQKYEFVTTQATFELVYPVSLRITDVLLVFALNVSLGWLVSRVVKV